MTVNAITTTKENHTMVEQLLGRLSGTIGAGAFSFGPPSTAESKNDNGSTASGGFAAFAGSTGGGGGGFTFGGGASGGGFSFGAKPSSDSKDETKTDETAVASSAATGSGFTFGPITVKPGAASVYASDIAIQEGGGDDKDDDNARKAFGQLAKTENGMSMIAISDFSKLIESMGMTYCKKEHRKTLKRLQKPGDKIHEKNFIAW
jgi:hypothetical protein